MFFLSDIKSALVHKTKNLITLATVLLFCTKLMIFDSRVQHSRTETKQTICVKHRVRCDARQLLRFLKVAHQQRFIKK